MKIHKERSEHEFRVAVLRIAEKYPHIVDGVPLGGQLFPFAKEVAALGCKYAVPVIEQEANMEDLHTLLDAAAGEGLVFNGVDAADLFYISIFRDRYNAAIAKQRDEAM